MTHRTPSHLLPALLALLIVGSACSSDGGTGPDGVRSVHVAVATEGDDLDRDGYTVTLGSDTRTVGSSGSVTFPDLPPGRYEVTLEGLAANCSVDGDATRSVSVTEGGDASVSFDVTCLFDAAGEALEVVACPTLAPAVPEAMPLDEVSLAGVPSDFERPLWARMSWDGGPLVSQGLVKDEGGEVTVTIPLHPSASPEGGEVTVRVSDEEQSCPPFTFRVLPLPAAPGEMAALADVIQDLLDQHTVLFGTTREDLLGTPIPEMEPALVPLAVAHAIVDGTSAESLRSYAAGAVPDFTSADLDLLERIVARTGLRADLEAELAAVLAEGAAASAAVGARLPGPARAFSPGVALDCITATALDAAKLDECMTLARDKIQGTASEKTQEAAMLAMDVAAILGSRKIAKPIGSLLTVSKLYDQAVAGVLPTSFVSIDVTPNPAEFMEDQEGPGTWAPARVMATSSGWNLDELTAELIAGRVSPGSGPKVPRLTWLQKRGLRAAYPELASALASAVGIENFFLDLREFLVKKLIELGVKELSDGSLAVPPRQFGPVDVTNTEWSDARIVTGTSVVLTPHELFDPREPGQSLLEVVTAVGKFGGTSIRTAHLPIDVREMEVTISPTDVALTAGQTQTFTITVTNSRHPTSIEIVPDPDFQGQADLVLGEGNTHTVRYTAPAAPPPNHTDHLMLRHTAESGARGHSSVERSASATIRFGTFRITTEPRCVEPGSPAFQIEVDHEGLVDPEWVWTTTAGDISDTGLFTPPTQAGMATISVALASNPDLEESLTLQIGGCSCLGTINVGGETAATTDMRFRLSSDLSGVESFSWRGEGVSDVGFWFGSDYLNPVLEVVPLNTTGQVEGMTQGLLNGQSFANPDDFDEPTIAPLTILISDNTGSIFAGTVAGSVSVADDPEPRIVPFTFDFHIEADPFLSDEFVKFCEVPQ